MHKKQTLEKLSRINDKMIEKFKDILKYLKISTDVFIIP